MISERQISKIFGISPELLKLPNLLTDFLFPLILFSIALYFITEKIFKSKAISGILAFCISFITIIISKLGGIIAPLSIFIICMMEIKGTKGIIIGIIAAIIYAFIIGWISDLFSPYYY